MDQSSDRGRSIYFTLGEIEEIWVMVGAWSKSKPILFPASLMTFTSIRITPTNPEWSRLYCMTRVLMLISLYFNYTVNKVPATYCVI